MIWSLCPLGYKHELDLFEIRLREQENVVDRWVVSESPWTYSGEGKPYHLNTSELRWARWAHRIAVVHVDTEPPRHPPYQRFGVPEHWRRENHQRREMRAALGDLEPDDVVVLSDCDEILRAETIALYAETTRSMVHPQLAMHRHYLNLHWRDRVALSIGRIFRGSYMLGHLDVEAARQETHVQEWTVPYWKAYGDPAFDLGQFGWHFSWMGGTRAIDEKLRVAAHPEELGVHNGTRTAIRELVAQGGDLQGENRPLFWLPDARLPHAAQLAKFKHLRCGPEFATEPGVDASAPGFTWNG